MSGTGTTRLLAGSAGTMSGGAFKILQSGRRLENGGTLSWVGGELISFSGGIVISNQAGALFEIKENALSLRDEGDCGSVMTIDNAGTLRCNVSGLSVLGVNLCNGGIASVNNSGLDLINMPKYRINS